MKDAKLTPNKVEQPQQLNLKKAIPVAFVLMWSSGAIFVEYGLFYASPSVFLFLRLLISAFILWGAVFYLKTLLPTNAKEWAYILITGLCMQAGYQIFFFLALDNSISPGILTIILGAQPIITATISKESNQRSQWIGLILGMIGLSLVVADSVFINSITFIGVLSAVLSLLDITVGTIMQKRIHINPPTNMALQYTGSAFILFVLVLISNPTIEWSLMFLVSLAWMILVLSVGATILLYYMIQKGNLTNVTSLFYCVPPVTVILDYFIFGNTLNLITTMGMFLIIVGLILVNRKGKFI